MSHTQSLVDRFGALEDFSWTDYSAYMYKRGPNYNTIYAAQCSSLDLLDMD